MVAQFFEDKKPSEVSDMIERCFAWQYLKPIKRKAPPFSFLANLESWFREKVLLLAVISYVNY